MRSDHKAVIAYTGAPPRQLNKTRERRVFRRRSPSQHALFLQHAPAATFEFHDGASAQSNFDVMYTIMRELLDRFYPEHRNVGRPALHHAGRQGDAIRRKIG